MADRETIAKGLHDIGGFIAGRVGIEQARNFLRTIDDTIELLKEQEDLGTELTNAVELIHKKNERIEKLLKEQEARWISVPHKRARICSHCEADEPYKFADDDAEVYEYCPHCGAKMTEGR